jgi:hypothetical protein
MDESAGNQTLKPAPYADDPRSKKIVVTFRPGCRPGLRGTSLYNEETYFRHNLTPSPGWLIISNGLEMMEKTDTLMWPTTSIFGVDVVSPSLDDECWVCLKTRVEHEPDRPAIVNTPPWEKISTDPDIWAQKLGHRFNWTFIGHRRRAQLEESTPVWGDEIATSLYPENYPEEK